MPLISVVMPAYNAADMLGESLASLAQQSFRDFEVVLVNDASTDGTLQVVDEFAAQLSLRVLHNEKNAGVARSLNRGVAAGDSEFVARLDADDLAQPQRLARQLAFLRDHPQVDLCGSHMTMFRSMAEGALGVLVQPETDATIKTALVQRNVISHPSVFARRSFFSDVGAYNPALDYAEDYDLWCRGALLGKHYANLSEPLTLYRVHAGQISQGKAQLQYERDVEARRRYIAALLGDTPPAYLPQLFAGATHFVNRDVAATAFAESSAALVALGARVRDAVEYAAIVRACMQRHLLEGRAT